MSRKEKLRQRMQATPDKIRFSQVDALLRYEGFERINRRGSHDTFRRSDGRILVVVRPHGGRKTCHPRDIQRILEALEP